MRPIRKKGRHTFTLSKRQVRILEQYGGRNKSKWLGNRIEEWYALNCDHYERLRNKMRWIEQKKLDLENEIWSLFKQKEKLDKSMLNNNIR